MVKQIKLNSSQDTVEMMYRLILMLPAIAFCIFIIVGSVFSSFFTNFTRLFIFGISIVFFNGILITLSLPYLISSALSLVPLIRARVVKLEGYYYVERSFIWMGCTACVLLLDHFFPPFVPKSKDVGIKVNEEDFDEF